MIMLATSFFSWWYGDGWKTVISGFGRRSQWVAASFSTRQLSKTLFAPWRRIITEPANNFDAKWHAALDNVFSRLVGFVVRITVLGAAGVTLVVVLLLTAVELVVWPLLPLAIPGCLVAGFTL